MGVPVPIRVKDKRRITISAPSSSIYQIDFDITMEMLEDVVILKTNHSLFSARLAPDLTVMGGGTMINAEGDQGEEATFGKRSPWMDYYGERMGKSEGIAIMQHPSSDGYPAPGLPGITDSHPMYWPENGAISF